MSATKKKAPKKTAAKAKTKKQPASQALPAAHPHALAWIKYMRALNLFVLGCEDPQEAAKRIDAGEFSSAQTDAWRLGQFIAFAFRPVNAAERAIPNAGEEAHLAWALTAASTPKAGEANPKAIGLGIRLVRQFARAARAVPEDNVLTVAFLLIEDLARYCEPRFHKLLVWEGDVRVTVRPEVAPLILSFIERPKQAGPKGKGNRDKLRGAESLLADLAAIGNAWGIRSVSRRADWITRNADHSAR